MKYKIKTPNQDWNGIANGVLFINGFGETKSKEVRDHLVNVYGYVDVTQQEEEEEKPSSKKRR